MKTYQFTLILAPLDREFDEDLCNAVYEACGDVSFSTSNGTPKMGFTLESDSLEAAIAKATEQARSVGLTPLRVVQELVAA